MLPEEIYDGIIHSRSTEATLGWVRNTFYSGTISTLYWLAITHFEAGTFALWATCSGGLAASLIWGFSAYRTRLMMDFWNKSLGKLETEDASSDQAQIFSTPEFDDLDKRRIRNHHALLFLIGGNGIAWLGLEVHATASLIVSLIHGFEKFRRIVEWIFSLKIG